jgi:hypothetical protein
MKRISYFILCWLGFILIPYYLGEWLLPISLFMHGKEPLLFFKWIIGFLTIATLIGCAGVVMLLSFEFLAAIDDFLNWRHKK